MGKMDKAPRTCGWCGRRIEQARIGRPRKWCSRYCGRKASEQRLLEAAQEAGKQRAIEELRGRPFLA
jgi:hypothetical protein